jgi:amidophosphoribosyltransferase
MSKVLFKASKNWDGGYAIAGMLGHGDTFVLRDPACIRPTYFYEDDEIVAVASERPVIQTVFNVPFSKVKELDPGHAIITKKGENSKIIKILDELPKKACSFERIYFSRGSDAEIYKERKSLGRKIFPEVLKSIDSDLKNTVFSYIPNTAEVSYFGMMKGVDKYLNQIKSEKIISLGKNPLIEDVKNIMAISPRAEKIAVKDAKLRTFITSDVNRDDLVAHVYDITYGKVKPNDNLVMIDDSIVRGTTLKQSILRILDRLGPKKIIVVSSAPQIRYPDCYGIDMAILGDFIAFQAAIMLLRENNKEDVINSIYERCKKQINLPKEEMVNYVKDIYEPFTAEQISRKISQILTPKDTRADVEIIYQSIEDLHIACPNHSGDWYFTGNYPTPGGNKVVTRAFINYIDGNNKRAY